ncbi:MAG: hypothetical protein ACI9ON_002306 [Limisphaerales bacterium]|jgi:hypothetical protein
MNWDAIGAVGEVVGAIAVLATLFYFAIQIRQNSRNVEESLRSLRLGAADSTVASFARYRELISQKDVAEIYVKGGKDYESLTECERVQFGAVMDEFLFSYWSVFKRVQEGAYEDADWQAHMASLREVLRRPGVAIWWGQRKAAFPPTFVQELDDHAVAIRPRD